MRNHELQPTLFEFRQYRRNIGVQPFLYYSFFIERNTELQKNREET